MHASSNGQSGVQSNSTWVGLDTPTGRSMAAIRTAGVGISVTIMIPQKTVERSIPGMDILCLPLKMDGVPDHCLDECVVTRVELGDWAYSLLEVALCPFRCTDMCR